MGVYGALEVEEEPIKYVPLTLTRIRTRRGSMPHAAT